MPPFTIYKIQSIQEPSLVFFGLTDNVIARAKHHEQICQDPTHPKYNRRMYSIIRSFGGWGAWIMSRVVFLICSHDEAKVLTNSVIAEHGRCAELDARRKQMWLDGINRIKI